MAQRCGNSKSPARYKHLRSSKIRQLASEYLSSSLKGTNEDSLYQFLKDLDLENYYHLFKAQEITYDDLRLLTKEDLTDMNILVGPRNRIAQAIRDLGTRQTEVKRTVEIPCENTGPKYKDLYMMIRKISNQHVEMMELIENNQKSIAELMCQDTSSVMTRGGYAKDTLSSISKKNLLPNKYMRVSPLRASYLSRRNMN